MVTYVALHLVANLLEEALLLLFAVFSLCLDVAHITSDAIVQILHHLLVELLLCSDLRLVALEGLPPGRVLDGVSVLDHTRVLLRLHVAAVVEGLDNRGGCFGQSGARLARLAVIYGLESASVLGRCSPSMSLSAAYEALALGDQVILQISSHLA